jgi:hypothetical protein
MRRQRGQGLLLFAAAVPVLLGCLGLAVDGGLYLTAWRTAQSAAELGARATVIEVRRGHEGDVWRYLSAASGGRSVTELNLAGLRISNVVVDVAFNDGPEARWTNGGWYGPWAWPGTRTARVNVSASYPTLFLRVLGVPALALHQSGTPPRAIATLGPGVLPLAVCTSTVAASPQGPWPLWRRGASLCGISAWEGLINLDGSVDECEDYYGWIASSSPTGPRLADGASARLDTRWCEDVDERALPYHSTRQWVVLVNGPSRTVQGCRLVQVTVNGYMATVDGTPVGAAVPCDSIWQVE